MTEQPWDAARRNALDRVDRSERRFYLAVILLVAAEMLFLWGFVRLAEFSNPVHVLIFWSTVSTHTLLMFGLAILWGPCEPEHEAGAEGHRSLHTAVQPEGLAGAATRRRASTHAGKTSGFSSQTSSPLRHLFLARPSVPARRPGGGPGSGRGPWRRSPACGNSGRAGGRRPPWLPRRRAASRGAIAPALRRCAGECRHKAARREGRAARSNSRR